MISDDDGEETEHQVVDLIDDDEVIVMKTPAEPSMSEKADLVLDRVEEQQQQQSSAEREEKERIRKRVLALFAFCVLVFSILCLIGALSLLQADWDNNSTPLHFSSSSTGLPPAP